jgi:hypothetical protein
MLRVAEMRVRNFRSLADVSVSDLPPVVLLYGDNDTGKSNFIDAVGAWLDLVRRFHSLSRPPGHSILHEGVERLWSGAADASAEHRAFVADWMRAFRYGETQLELGGTLIADGPGEPAAHRFAFRVQRRDETRLHVRVTEAVWPAIGRASSPVSDAAALSRLGSELPRAWTKVAAERRFTTEFLPTGVEGQALPAPDPTGADLKLQLFRAANGANAARRRLFRDRFCSVVEHGPFALPPPRPVLADDGATLELLLDEHRVEDRGSGPQHWLLMAGLLTMSECSIAGIEEPEAHFAWDGQDRVASALAELLRVGPPHQLFVATHSVLMKEIAPANDDWFLVRMQDGATRIERQSSREKLRARFASPEPVASDRRLVLLPGRVVRLTDELVAHLGAQAGELLFALREDDGSVRLLSEATMDKRLDTRDEAGE